MRPGRGPLCGPVCAARPVILDPAKPVPGVNDSKKLSEKKREALFDEISGESAGLPRSFLWGRQEH